MYFKCQWKGGGRWFVLVGGRVVSLAKVMKSTKSFLQKQGSQSHTFRFRLCLMDISLRFQILNGTTVTIQAQLSIAVLSSGFNIEWMIISFPLLSLSLTCRNGQFMQAAPWPGKVDAPRRRKAATFQTIGMGRLKVDLDPGQHWIIRGTRPLWSCR